MIVAGIGLVSMILLVWTLAFAMETESNAEQRRNLRRDNRTPLSQEPNNYAA